MHHELFLSFHPTSCISSCPLEVTAEDSSSCDDSLCEPDSWPVHHWAGGGRNTSTVAMNNTAFGRENVSGTGHFSRPLWLFAPTSSLEGSSNPECIIFWRSFWLDFDIRHKNENLEKKFSELIFVWIGLIRIMQRQSCVLQHKGDSLITNISNLGLKHPRGREIPLW